jgi:hypothetical protein
VLKVQNFLKAALELIAAGNHLAQGDGRLDHDGGVSLECGEEDVLARHQSLKPVQHRAPLGDGSMND